MTNIPQAYIDRFLRHYLAHPVTGKMPEKVFGSPEELLFRNEKEKAIGGGYTYVCSQDGLEVILSYKDNGELRSTLWTGPYVRRRANEIAAPGFPLQFSRAMIRVGFEQRVWDAGIKYGLSPVSPGGYTTDVPMSLDEVITRYDPDLEGMVTPKQSETTKAAIEKVARKNRIGGTVKRAVGDMSIEEGREFVERLNVGQELNKPTVIRAAKRMRDLFRRQGIAYRTVEDITRSVQSFIGELDEWGLDHELKYIE